MRLSRLQLGTLESAILSESRATPLNADLNALVERALEVWADAPSYPAPPDARASIERDLLALGIGDDNDLFLVARKAACAEHARRAARMERVEIESNHAAIAAQTLRDRAHAAVVKRRLPAEAERLAEKLAREELALIEERRRDAQLQRERWLNRPAPAPQPQRYGVSHEGAEQLVADWLRHLGALDATVTRYSSDGGIDVASKYCVAQVKNIAGAVPVSDIRALHGVAAAESKYALLFTSGSVTAEGRSFAQRTGMALISYDAKAGRLIGLNPLGTRVVDLGVEDGFREPDT